MTTLVKVIALDWPVAVMTKDEYPGREAVFTPDRVEPHGERCFYLTSMRSIKFEELQKPEVPTTPETGATQYAWLIEAGGNRSAPIYWDGGDWSADHLRAVRFTRQADAERVMANIAAGQRQSQMSAVEHGWHVNKADEAVADELAAAIAIDLADADKST